MDKITLAAKFVEWLTEAAEEDPFLAEELGCVGAQVSARGQGADLVLTFGGGNKILVQIDPSAGTMKA